MGNIEISVSLVRQLVATQFPQWANFEIRPVEFDGHDNRTFHLGDEMSVRMPSHERYVGHVSSEQKWLPKLSQHLPLPIPEPVGVGKPGPDYPWPWTVNRWVQGDNASLDNIYDLNEFAKDLAGFLNALQAVDAADAPKPGKDNFYRGGQLSMYDSEARECIEALSNVIDTSAAKTVWDLALEATWKHAPVWIHGDIAVGNLLVRNGKLCAVIDFGQLAAGDPSCDTTIAWTLFSDSSKEVFQAEFNVDDATWARGRGWALWKALLGLKAHRANNPQNAVIAKEVILNILAEHDSLTTAQSRLQKT